MKTVGEVRQEILKELGIDQTRDVIRRDLMFCHTEVVRGETSNFRMFNDGDIEKVKLMALLRDIGGLSRKEMGNLVGGDKGGVTKIWERINHLRNMAIPILIGKLPKE